MKTFVAETNHIEEGGRVTVTCNATEVSSATLVKKERRKIKLKQVLHNDRRNRQDRRTMPQCESKLGKLVNMARSAVLHFWY